MTCWSDKCATTRACPRAFFSATDWNKCSGEVFRIYKPQTGEIHVGDLVGIYYPHQRGRWFSCWVSQCAKATCPGNPTSRYGFSKADKWYECDGEVFKIYVYGKNNGDRVTSGDLITLYYIKEKNWVNGGTNMVKDTCVGSAPPGPSQYDNCAQESFIIIKK